MWADCQVAHFIVPLSTVTFNVLRLMSSKDLSEEQREDKLALSGKIIKLNALTRCSEALMRLRET